MSKPETTKCPGCGIAATISRSHCGRCAWRICGNKKCGERFDPTNGNHYNPDAK